MSRTATAAPASASARLWLRPCPRAAPVTSATWPVRSGTTEAAVTGDTSPNCAEPPNNRANRVSTEPHIGCTTVDGRRSKRCRTDPSESRRTQMAGSTAERWLSVSEAGRALGLSRTSLLAAEEAGLLASVRTPGGHRRYRPAELRRYLRAAGAWPEATGAPVGAADAVLDAAGRPLDPAATRGVVVDPAA